MILFFRTLFLIFSGDKRWGQRFPAANTAAIEALSAAIACAKALGEVPEARSPAFVTPPKAANLLHVNAHVDPTAPNKKFLRLIIESITLTLFSSRAAIFLFSFGWKRHNCTPVLPGKDIWKSFRTCRFAVFCSSFLTAHAGIPNKAPRPMKTPGRCDFRKGENAGRNHAFFVFKPLPFTHRIATFLRKVASKRMGSDGFTSPLGVLRKA